MSSIRLRHDQVQKLRRCDNAAAVIRYAVRRWKRGDFPELPSSPCAAEPLEVYPLHDFFDLSDETLRSILDAHFAIPDEAFRSRCDAEITRLDREVQGYLKCLPPFIIE